MCSRYWFPRCRMTSQNRTLRWNASVQYSMAGAKMPNVIVFGSVEGRFGDIAEFLLFCLVHDVVATVDIERFASDQSGRVVCEKGSRDPDVVNTDKTACWGL